MTGTMLDADRSIRMLRSGFGRQVKSEQQSLPAYGFGTSHRDSTGRLYLSPEQAKAMHGNNSQGPVYKSYEAVGPQPESRHTTAPAPGFGTAPRSQKSKHGNYPGPGSYSQEGALGPMKESKRATSPRTVFGQASRETQSKVWLDDELMKTYAGRFSPGPCTYKTPGSLGKQVDSKYTTEPGWVTSTSERFKSKNASADLPGAGSYNVNNNALGKQALSHKKTLPSPKIGTGTRDAFKRVFISKDHEKGAFGEWSPGPVTSQVVNSVGPQTMSVKKTNPSWGFGTSKRSKDYGSDSPGPGSYFA
ncbi:flagellar associated protein [Dunaliella salina]|uniref:Flagellar associated protein n=1 Tax=Dunaliella salina TaxID=3046 RepID=A0ABQ7FZZ8_DUNSA|nr:flagellar associated protein [Dunaliella salina]|eukprot:KAF5827930.1 flagellar associated protein [Dunaliella salina]